MSSFQFGDQEKEKALYNNKREKTEGQMLAQIS